MEHSTQEIEGSFREPSYPLIDSAVAEYNKTHPEYSDSDRADRKLGVALKALKETKGQIDRDNGNKAVNLSKEMTELMFREGKDTPPKFGTETWLQDLEKIAVERHLLSLAQTSTEVVGTGKDYQISKRLEELQDLEGERRRALSGTGKVDQYKLRTGKEIMDDMAKKIIAKQGDSAKAV